MTYFGMSFGRFNGMAMTIGILTFALARAACADTYTIKEIGFLGTSAPVGITADGTVVIEQELGIPEDVVYDVYPVDGPWYVDFNAPSFTYDNGTFGCTPVTSAAVSWASAYGSTTCNGSREEYEGFYTVPGTSTVALGVFTGPDLSDLVTLPGFDPAVDPYLNGVFLNSSGDLFGQTADGYFEAIDVSAQTPEPSGLWLAGTGAAVLAGALRRRFVRMV